MHLPCLACMRFRVDYVLSGTPKLGGVWLMLWISLVFFMAHSYYHGLSKLNFSSIAASAVLIVSFLDRMRLGSVSLLNFNFPKSFYTLY